MGIPAYMWLRDDGGSMIRGSSTVDGREGSIEIIGFGHGLNLPVDGQSGKITGPRMHSPMHIEKAFDAATPYLYKAVATGQTLESANVRWYRINDAGREEEYFSMSLEDVRITGINPVMPNIKTAGASQINHIESISLLYERITWHYKDGNIRFTDSWLDR